MAKAMGEMPRESTLYAVNHLFLPPELPGEHDYSQHSVKHLVNFVLQTAEDFSSRSQGHHKLTAEKLRDVLREFNKVHTIGSTKVKIEELTLKACMWRICENDGYLLLEITSQNAGMLISRAQDAIRFELFELTPNNATITGTEGRLVRNFPAQAIAIPISVIQKGDIIKSLAKTISKMSSQINAIAQPTATKAASERGEVRESANPFIVTQYFSSLLLALGSAIEVPSIEKKMREEVMYESCMIPWTRSQTWLLFRAALHLIASRLESEVEICSESPRAPVYKEFITFLLARLLEGAHQHSLDSDLLSIMSAKVSRRLRKMGSTASPWVQTYGSSVVRKTTTILEQRWGEICSKDARKPHFTALKNLNIDKDTFAAIPKLDVYLQALDALDRSSSQADFAPGCRLADLNANDLPSVAIAQDDYRTFHLARFEAWVEKHLDNWLQRNISSLSACKNLCSVLFNYHAAAHEDYKANPHATSIMVLTCLELWIACNKSAHRICPKLAKYHDASVPPGLIRALVQSLALPHKTQLQRLELVEKYLDECSAQSRSNARSIFTSFGDRNSFYIEYYETSVEQQQLHNRIDRDATDVRRMKREELASAKSHYNYLKSRADSLNCEYYQSNSYNGYRRSYHSSSCQKCRLESDYEALKIEVHEWPLPRDNLDAQNAVFELQPPEWFPSWRDATDFLLQDVLSLSYPTETKADKKYHLFNYKTLSQYVSGPSAQRIKAVSEIKPVIDSHYNSLKIGAIIDDSEILVNHGSEYKYLNSKIDAFTSSVPLTLTETLSRQCMYKLPAADSAMQQFLYRPEGSPSGPPPNHVIAKQHLCPKHMKLPEFRELCTIPLGYKLQWQNILRQLQAPSVDFNQRTTFIFIAQCVTQAGPRSKDTILRESHTILSDPVFSRELLEGVDKATTRIAESWQSTETLRACIIIATRALQLTTDETTIRKCLEYLQRARKIALAWAVSLRGKVRDSNDATFREKYRRRAADCALVCSMAFDLDENRMSSELQSPITASQFLQCSMIAREGNNLPGSSGGSADLFLWEWQCVSYRAMPILSASMTTGSNALDDAISSSWSGHSTQQGWKPVSAGHPEWLVGIVHDTNSPIVRFNLLTGELLVNGLPLDRLPAVYENHPTYMALFGRSIIDVMPGTVPGYPFSTNAAFAEHDVQFSLVSSELFVRAENGGNVLHYVPGRLLDGIFPDAFVDEYIHFYDEKTGKISLRPTSQPWVVPSQPWLLSRAEDGETSGLWVLSKEKVAVISLSTATSTAVANILGTLETEPRIHCLASADRQRLGIELPGLQTRFYLKSGDITVQCRDFQGMIIDENQGIGTLVGLANKLVLRSENVSSESSPPDRLVLVPDGDAKTIKTSAHVSLDITKPPRSFLHAYRVDTLVGRLVDGGDLRSKLFLAQLHALTAFCIPDSLTSRTGTEEALHILRSAAVRSAPVLSKEAIALLGKIAALTPKRKYYPEHLRSMQQVQWSLGLGFLAQHDGFADAVEAIVKQAQSNKFFYDDQPEIPSDLFPHGSRDLLRRHQIRVAQFRVATFGGEKHTIRHDHPYSLRDKMTNDEMSLTAYAVSDSLVCGTPETHTNIKSSLVDNLWQFLEQHQIINADSSDFEIDQFAYDAGWFLPWKEKTKSSIATNWLQLHSLLSGMNPEKHRQSVTTWLAAISCAEGADVEIVHVLNTFFVSSSTMSQVQLPTSTTHFSLRRGRTVQRDQILNIISKFKREYNEYTDNIEQRREYESYDSFNDRGFYGWKKRVDAAADQLVTFLAAQWPCESPNPPWNQSDVYGTADKYFYMTVHTEGLSEIRGLFCEWFQNLQFYNYLGKICAVVSRKERIVSKPAQPPMPVLQGTSTVSKGSVSVDKLFHMAEPPASIEPAPSLRNMLAAIPASQGGIVDDARTELDHLIQSLGDMAISPYKEKYVDKLKTSREALEKGNFSPKTLSLDKSAVESELRQHLSKCQNHADVIYKSIRSALINNVADVHQLPRVSPMLLLEQLSHKNRAQLRSEDWKKVLVGYGLALTELQRARRLVNARDAALIKELQNQGHQNWDPHKQCEWLLLEIEGGIIIRNVQVDIATQMQNPTNGKNAVMQLNMGEGKSSVIVPMLATALADGDKLMRVIVAKPQSKQMLHMLVSKLGGLVDRQVFHLPFSRAVKVGEAELDAIGQLLSSCRKEGGVLLVQPEHILSFQLIGIERKINGKDSIADKLLPLHEFMRAHSRDVVDESDENFSPKFELVYSLGAQQPIDHAPGRWTCVQEVLDVVRKYLPEIYKEFPHGIDVREGLPGCFPRTRVIESKAMDRLLDLLADHVCEYGVKGFPIQQSAPALRRIVREYIRNTGTSKETIDRVEAAPPVGFWTDATKETLLLLRGLIANGILAFALGHKRWRVDYGLDTSRSPPTSLAVPYRAKDHPSARSEFSHPDVVIVLTCLSYYYQGLSNQQLDMALNHLYLCDQSADEYATWTKDANKPLSSSFVTLSGLNLEDTDLCNNELFPCFQKSKAAVDYFLAHVVFTKEMKEFPTRLSASGWDIGEQTPHPTTGFSGTNDAQIVLPLSVTQTALSAQAHTNALVLQHLLQKENTVETIPSMQQTSSEETASESSQPSTGAEQLLNMVKSMKPPVRVILDVGAQIIELDNLAVAKKWLDLLADDSGTEAAVFVDKHDDICVVDRQGRIEPLHTSPYYTRLGLCVVFLDDAHTRGTDLKLPEDYRAAVTLGANLVKDRLVQACMRMRELGRGQSVVFCVPEEIHRKIQGLRSHNKDGTDGTPRGQVSVSDVLAWSINETWQDAKRNTALWASQGTRHEHHSQLWAQARGGSSDIPGQRDLTFDLEMANRFLEPEAQPIEARYRPTAPAPADVAPVLDNNYKNKNQSDSPTQVQIAGRCADLDAGKGHASSAILQEEQERELAPETEEERQLERPDKAEPLRHSVHPDVDTFVRSGVFPPSPGSTTSTAIMPVYRSLSQSSAGGFYTSMLRSQSGARTSPPVYCTRDFADTIEPPAGGYLSDSYHRPVQWVLISTTSIRSGTGLRDDRSCRRNEIKTMLIISPYEAQELIDVIRRPESPVSLHLYAPLTNQTFRSLDRLDLYTVPATRASVPVEVPINTILELDLFAGQLYFKTYAEFEALREYLLLRPGNVASKSTEAATDGDESARVMDEHLVSLLNVVMKKIRRNCETIDKTHTGKALDCRRVMVKEFGGENFELTRRVKCMP